ncbi:MAG: addiction module protein [Pseudomonadota bacterium]
MGNKEILDHALRLPPEERFLIIEGLLRSLDEPDATIDAVWATEAEARLRAVRSGKVDTVPADEVLGA